MSIFTKKRQVMMMNLSDISYDDRPIERLEEKGFITKKVEGQINHFWQGGPGWKGKTIRYLGCRGHALVSWIKGVDEQVEGSISEFLRFMWGNVAYEKLPFELRNLIETQVGVIVTVDPDIAVDDAAKYKINRLQAEALLSRTTIDNMEGLGVHEDKKPWPQSLAEKVPWMGLGALIVYLLVNNKIIR